MMPRKRVLDTPFRMDRILAREARQIEAARPHVPTSQIEPLMGLAAAGDLPRGAQTDHLVEKYLEKAWADLRYGWDVPDGASAGS